MIFDVSGNQLTAAYDVSGNSLSAAYDMLGEKIFGTSGEYDYTDFAISSASVGRQGQGIDVYGTTLAVWVPSTNNGSLNLYNLNTKNRFTYFTIDTTSHGNDLSFAPEFYGSEDTLPLLYIAGTGYRVAKTNGTWGATQIKTLLTPDVYGSRMGMAFNGDVLLTAGYLKDSYNYSAGNDVIIAKWDMNNLTDNGDGTFTVGLISTAHHAWFNCIQGVAYHDGLLWVVCGLGGTNAVIYALDPDTAEIVYTIDSGMTGEPEGLAWAYNDTDGWYMLYWHKNQGGMKKVTFAH